MACGSVSASWRPERGRQKARTTKEMLRDDGDRGHAPGFDFPAGVEAWRQDTILDRPPRPAPRLYRSLRACGAAAGWQVLGPRAGRARRHCGRTRNRVSRIERRVCASRRRDREEATVGHVRVALMMLLGVVGACCSIACANVYVSHARADLVRRHETAVRIALGAGTGRSAAPTLVRDRCDLAARRRGASGIASGTGHTTAVARAPGDIPRAEEVAFGGPVVLFTTACRCWQPSGRACCRRCTGGSSMCSTL